jgi:hypothetical protein
MLLTSEARTMLLVALNAYIEKLDESAAEPLLQKFVELEYEIGEYDPALEIHQLEVNERKLCLLDWLCNDSMGDIDEEARYFVSSRNYDELEALFNAAGDRLCELDGVPTSVGGLNHAMRAEEQDLLDLGFLDEDVVGADPGDPHFIDEIFGAEPANIFNTDVNPNGTLSATEKLGVKGDLYPRPTVEQHVPEKQKKIT